METFPSAPNGKIEREPQLLSDVEPIEESGVALQKKEDIGRFVEFPLVDACKDLYDKNIQTWQSSANKKDILLGRVVIVVAYDTLSEENKQIARNIGEQSKYDRTELASLSVPVSEKTSVAEIKEKMSALVDQFQPQAPIWIEARTVDDFSKLYGAEMTEEDLINWPAEEGGWYFDKDSRLFYPSEEQFKKVADWNKEHKD